LNHSTGKTPGNPQEDERIILRLELLPKRQSLQLETNQFTCLLTKRNTLWRKITEFRVPIILFIMPRMQSKITQHIKNEENVNRFSREKKINED
jgi:hypothetical protein